MLRCVSLGAFLIALGTATSAFALSGAEARERAQSALSGVEGGLGSVKAAAAKASRQKMTPAQRVAAGDILFRNKDYERAIEVFSQVVELGRQGRADSASLADGLFFLGESYLKTKQYLSARRAYREIVDKGSSSPYDSYAGRAVSRLIDIALRTQNYESLDEIFAKLNSLPSSGSDGSLQYARGKALFAKKDYDAAKTAVGNVPVTGMYGLQAQYLLGVILVQQATPATGEKTPAIDQPTIVAKTSAAEAVPTSRYAAAIEQFRKVTRMKAETDAHRHVIDLAWMAIGRLFYETDNFLDAADAYSHVDRKSPEFSNMLYELAWVYVRLGDYQRAQRALEVLSISDPENLRFADGSLLRADLMLRSGQFEKALALYRSVRSRFDPIREQVSTFLADTQDPAVYYDKLVEEQLDAQGKGALSPVVIQWAREESENDRAFAMIDDVAASRDLIKKSRRLVTKLNAVLGSTTRMRAFPEIQAAMEQTLSLMNKSAQARRTLAMGMDDEAGSASGELESVRRERRALMKRMDQLPVTPADFSNRVAAGEKQWNKVSQRLQQLELEADKLQAIANGLKRVLRDADKFGVSKDAQSRQRFQAEIAANERDLETYRKRIGEYREMVDMGRVQVGFGDQRFIDDDATRKRFRELFHREVELTAGGADPSAAEYARSIRPLLARADAVEDNLEATKARLEKEADAASRDLRQQVDAETANIEQYASNLDDLDQQARLLVGEVAMKNFGLVRDRLKSIVLRADVGIVQHAWEVREEQLMRVRNLQRERAREEQNLNDELREVIDDAGGEP
jgi:tetratricopeptide (TPR) repeat protein